MPEIMFRPLGLWPAGRPKPTEYKAAAFATRRPGAALVRGASYEKTMRMLDVELDAIHAESIIVEVDLPASQLRRDGKPYATSRPRCPDIVLRFERRMTTNGKPVPVVIPCATFDDWVDNLYAIAMTLHDLRRIARYGTAAGGEQYTGWNALPAAGGTTLSAMSLDTACEKVAAFLFGEGIVTGTQVLVTLKTNAEKRRDWLRVVKKRTHPDNNGGRSGDFALLMDAARIIERDLGT